MLKGYVKATPENVKVSQKCYLIQQGEYSVHRLMLNSFGVIKGNLELHDIFGDGMSNIEVIGKHRFGDYDLEQIVYLNSLLVKEDN